MPDNANIQPNPAHPDEWAKMSDAHDLYVVVNGTVGHARTTRIYEVSREHGPAVKPRKTSVGDFLEVGAIVSAKTFGPGADIQRLVDLGVIRPATKWEADTVAAELSGEAEKTRKAEAEKAEKVKADAAKAEPVKAEPAKSVEPVKATPEPDKK